MEHSPERYFYHSFPRRIEKTNEVEKGLKILGLIKKMGLLLTPDNLKWDDVQLGGSSPEGWTISQVRCCFTDLGPNELARHAEEFGHFALEFDIQVLRQLGAIPVFYLPFSPIGGAEQLATEIVACVGDMQTFLDNFLKLEELVQTNPNKDKEDLLSSLIEGIKHPKCLIGPLKALSGFFYPIDDLNRTDLLGYYRQREWRILGNMGELTRSLETDERESLLQLDREFFEENLKFGTGIHARINECKVFQEMDGKPIIGYARRVIVPAVAVQRAKKIVNEYPPVIALESIGSN